SDGMTILNNPYPQSKSPLAQDLRDATACYAPGGRLGELLSQAKQVLEMESSAINAMAARLDASFERAIDLLQKCTGKVVVTGMGKSGHVATKIAATFASTGTPAFFVHPAELRHGDFGALDEKDLVVALSGSGETSEIKFALPPIKRLGIGI